MFGRPGPLFSRVISSRRVPTIRCSSANSFHCCTTRLFSSAGERRSISAGDNIPTMNLTHPLLGIVKSYRHRFCPCYPLFLNRNETSLHAETTKGVPMLFPLG